ncbi:MAG: alpha-L-fucosidase [Rikenellaceae bacterium]
MKRVLLLLVAALSLSSCAQQSQTPTDPVLDFLNNRFGMFIHFNMGTFHGEQWAQPNHDPKSFNPQHLDCGQWADAAKSAQMTYGVFTTKHHDGFCLWDTSVTDYDVASSSYDGDIVREYVDAFRSRDLKVGFYFSVWDRQHEIAKNNVSEEDIEFTKQQLTELLTNYGEIICLVIDGWGSVWGRSPSFTDIPFEVLADHIHSIQPNCLVINHSCRTDKEYTQVVHYEATHGQHCPYDNTIASQQGPTIQPAWFWEKGYEKLNLKSLSSILSELDFCNSHYANYLLNAAPNSDGLMDQNVVDRLREVGEAWRRPAPLQALPVESAPHRDVVAQASSQVEDPRNALDANLYSYWQATDEDEKPTITLDFGKVVSFNNVICGEANNCYDVEEFFVEALVNGEWQHIGQGEEMGFHWDHRFEGIAAQQYRVIFTKFKRAPRIAEITFVKYNEI